MALDLSQHPCFNDKVRHESGRVHLPVAPRCNIQCRYCNRRYDCVNESRPGVSCVVQTPAQALDYLDRSLERDPRIRVVGIAGPGDPMANPEETLATLHGVRERYPEMLLCLATNGLALAPHIEELGQLKVSHVTLTINALDAELAARFYAWVRDGRTILRGPAAAELLRERQLAAIPLLKAQGILVKVNTILVPGVNLDHIAELARTLSGMGVDILNCMALQPVEGSEWEAMAPPDSAEILAARRAAGAHLPQMHHCTRCRADAVGLIAEPLDGARIIELKESIRMTCDPERQPYVAVASHEGMLVNQHLGEAMRLLIYRMGERGIELVESRPTPPSGGGAARWEDLATLVADCRAVVISGIGESPKRVLTQRGVQVVEHEGLIQPALEAIYGGRGATLQTPPRRACGEACGGNGRGCA